MTVLRWLNVCCGTLITFCALVAALFLPAGLAEYQREPEDVWLLMFWFGMLGLLATLCFVNAWAIGKNNHN